MKRKIFTIFAISLAVVLLVFLIKRTGGVALIGNTFLTAFHTHPLLLVVGILFFGISLFCGITRWYVLLKELNLPLSYVDCIRLYAVGHFCNMIGPGALGGDVVKATWVAKKCPNARTEVITSIAAERFIGMFALVFFISCICICNWSFFDIQPALKYLRQVVLIVTSSTIVFLVLLLAINWGNIVQKFQFDKNTWKGKLVDKFYRSWVTLRICMTHPKSTGIAFIVSLLNHIVDVCCYYILSRSIEMSVNFSNLIVCTPIANTVAAVPITPGGTGVRENVLHVLLSAVGVPSSQSTTLGLLMFTTLLFWALVGGATTYFMTKKHI